MISEIQKAVSRGNLYRDKFDPEKQIPLYLGSGSSGALFDCYGLIGQDMHFPGNDAGTFKHAEYYARGVHGIDYWLSAFTIKFAQNSLSVPREYIQSLDLFKGQLKTSFTMDGHKLSSLVYMNPAHRDFLTYELDGAWQLAIAPVQNPHGSYDEEFTSQITVRGDGYILESNISSLMVAIQVIHISGPLPEINRGDSQTVIKMQDGARAMLVMAICAQSRFKEVSRLYPYTADTRTWRESSEKAWAKRWGNSYLNLTDDMLQADWARSLYYVLCSFSPDGIPSAPMGWTGLGWRFHFPQDISFIHPALLRHGHYDLAKRVVEFYYERIDDMLAITHRIYGGKGIMWAWEFPTGHGTDLLRGTPPNHFQFEIHNAAYPARMAYETAMHLKDDDWTQKYALPIIKHSADFYASHLVKEANGKYSLAVVPSMSQDEWAEPDGKNYLCALYSARYTFRVAAEMGLHDYDEFIKAGLAFDRLVDPVHGIYRCSEIMRENNFGNAKHPVPLNPLVFLPAPSLNEYEENAYRTRYDICSATKQHIYHGWTLAMFWLASSHHGNADALAQELRMADDDNYRDPERLEFYETSGATTSMYYVTTHGIYLQAILDAFVSDFTGHDVIESAVPASWAGSEYVNLHTAHGTYTGIINNA